MHRIAHWRTKLNISQSELARRAEISQSHISKLEKGIKMPSFFMLFKIAKALGICPKDLLSCASCPEYKADCKSTICKKQKALD